MIQLTEKYKQINKSELLFFILVQISILLTLFIPQENIHSIGTVLIILFFICSIVNSSSFFVFLSLITFAIPSEIIAKKFIINVGVNLYAMDFILIGGIFITFIYWVLRIGNFERCDSSKYIAIFLISIPLFIYISYIQGNQLKNILADARLFLYYSSFFIALFLIRSKKDVYIIVWSMLILGTLGAIPRIIESLSTRQFDETVGVTLSFKRITGYDEINYPLLLVVSIILIPVITKKYQRILLIITLLISLLALLLSYTRGSWIASLLGIVFAVIMYTFYSPLSKIKKQTLLFVIVLALLFMIIIDVTGVLQFSFISNRITLVSSKKIDLSSLERITEWVSAYNSFKKSPLFGSGLGHMIRYYAIGAGYKENIFIHNSYLYVICKMGIIGFLLFIAIYIVIMKTFFSKIKYFTEEYDYGIYLLHGAMIVVLMVKSFSTWHLNTISNVMYIGIIFAVIERYPQLYLKEKIIK